jgi:hypothetical protein
MAGSMGKCQVCGTYARNAATFCERCELSIFQVTETLELYVKMNPAPDWLVGGIRELAWIFTENPRTQGYLNTAREVTWMFTLDELEEVGVDDVMEVNYAQVPRDDILTLLEEALLVERKDDKLVPGTLVRKLRQVRLEGYAMNTPEVEARLLEIQGILSIALIGSIVKRKKYIPRRALAVLHMLSQNMIRSGESIEQVIPNDILDLVFVGLTSRQKRHVQYIMSGLADGKTKILSDVTDDGLSLKEVMVTYCEKMRERWRERERERAGRG